MDTLGEAVYSVSELNAAIRERLESAFDSVWVEGEVSNLAAPPSGHIYFTLKDEASTVRCVLFRGQRRFVPFDLAAGQLLLLHGRVTVYDPRGEYQVIVDRVEPRGTGALQIAFEQLRVRLEKEGLFDPARKKPIPVLPRRIGIVTSPTGAAIRDILQILDRRFPNLEILIYPALVQGAEAPGEICSGISAMNRYPEVDVIIVTRGGGSIEDLWAFNDETVARAIAASRLPVISAVGHEIDMTISDHAADLRAPTPSAAAELVVREKIGWLEAIESLTERLGGAIDNRIGNARDEVERLDRRLVDPRRRLEEGLLRVDECFRRLEQLLRTRLRLARSGLEGAAGRLNSLSPLAVLSRGYSITWSLPEGRILKRARDTKAGKRVRVRLHQGEMDCRVETVIPAGGSGERRRSDA